MIKSGIFAKFRLKNRVEFVMNKNPVSFLVNPEEESDDSFFQKPMDSNSCFEHLPDDLFESSSVQIRQGIEEKQTSTDPTGSTNPRNNPGWPSV
jgi:hypothetical protein